MTLTIPIGQNIWNRWCLFFS